MSYEKQKEVNISVTLPLLPPQSDYNRLLATMWKRTCRLI